MKKSITFYIVTGILLAGAVTHAMWRSMRNTAGDPDPTHYIYMSPVERTTEFNSLNDQLKTTNANAVTPEEYFRTLMRFARLNDAMRRAELEGTKSDKLSTASGPKGYSAMGLSDDRQSLQFLQNEYVNHAYRALTNSDGGRVEKARKDSGVEPQMYSHAMPFDPFTGRSWAIVYFAGLFLAFGHFHIRNQKLGGNILLASDPRFWLWLSIWMFGLFRYPTAIDVKYQLLRAKRFATFLLSTCLPLTAAACAGKQVKVPGGKQNTPRTLHVDTSTTTWPDYVGMNGAVFHPATVQHSVATASLGKAYVGTFLSAPLAQRDLTPNFGNEVDLFGGVNGQTRGISWNIDVNYVGVTPVAKHAGDAFVVSLTAKRNFKIGANSTLTPSMTFQRAMPVNGPTPGAGNFLRGKIGWGLNKSSWSLGADAELAHDSGAFGFNPGYFTRLGANIGRAFNKKLRLDLPIKLDQPLSHFGDGRKTEFRMGLTLSYAIR
ncbi:MAG: hypothetical protein KBC81_01295 [Candidatus Pacebacteria bacterium]|nr:hypothetical protein [Candidatus Paceibacterota bacterium]